jgi:hypothetical protein
MGQYIKKVKRDTVQVQVTTDIWFSKKSLNYYEATAIEHVDL